MLWNAGGNIIYLGTQWLMTVLVANIGQFHDAGILSLAMSISATFQTIAMFGIRNFQISDVKNQYSDTSYVKFRILTCMLALLSCCVFSLFGGYGAEQFISVAIFMLFRLSENFSDVLHGIAQKRDRLDIAGKSFALKGILTISIFVTVYKLTGSLNIGLGAMTAASWCCTVLYDIIATKKLSSYKLWQKDTPWISLAKETLPLCIYLFLSAAIYTLPKLILEQKCGEEILGAYSSIFAPALLISTAAGYLYTPFVPTFAQLYSEKSNRKFVSVFFKIIIAITAFAIVTLVAAVFLGDFALKLLFGDKIIEYTYLLIPILISIFVNAVFTFLCAISVVFRDFLGLLVACSAGLLSEVALTGIWIDKAGINATSYSYILGCLIAGIILIFRIIFKLYKNKNS